MDFKVGDNVVYPPQGAGNIQEITSREVLGETHKYLKIVFIRGDMEVLVPLKKASDVGLRHTISTKELARIHDTLLKADLSLPEQWPPRYRAEQKILTGGSAYEIAKLIGLLAKQDLDKGLALTEREVFETAKTMLAGELAVVQGQTLETAKTTLDEFIGQKISSLT
ncbi:MAG: CarD family transcriptional regulator [Trueperaceae bacterium]